MVICNGSELFTGNCLMVISLLDHKITFKALMKNYLFVYLGNLIGSLFGVRSVRIRTYSRAV